MFSKLETSPPAAAPATSTSSGKSVLGADLHIVGDVTSTGLIELHGVIEGNISAQSIVIGSDGAVNGTISAASVDIKGRFDGRASTETFTLRSSSNVQADVTYATITVETGAQMQGRLTLAKQG